MSFIENLNWRYATKKFDGRKIPEETLEKILTAIRLSPSSFGLQPYHISVIESDELKKTLKSHEWSKQQIITCSHLLVFSTDSDIDKVAENYLKSASKAGRTDVTDDTDFDYRKEAKDFANKMGPEWSAKQVYIALGFALAACAELKVDSCPIESINFGDLKEFLKLPDNLQPKVLLAIGYRSPDDNEAGLAKIRSEKQDLFDFR